MNFETTSVCKILTSGAPLPRKRLQAPKNLARGSAGRLGNSGETLKPEPKAGDEANGQDGTF